MMQSFMQAQNAPAPFNQGVVQHTPMNQQSQMTNNLMSLLNAPAAPTMTFIREFPGENCNLSHTFPGQFKSSSGEWASSQQYYVANLANYCGQRELRNEARDMKLSTHLPDGRPDLEGIKSFIGSLQGIYARISPPPGVDFRSVAIQYLRQALYYRFLQNSAMEAALMATGEQPVVYISSDSVLGINEEGQTHEQLGANMLGRLLMELRNNLKTHGRDAFKWAYEIPTKSGADSQPRPVVVEQQKPITKPVETEPVIQKAEAQPVEDDDTVEDPELLNAFQGSVATPAPEVQTPAPVEEKKEPSAADIMNSL
jgi:hypothetical protein